MNAGHPDSAPARSWGPAPDWPLPQHGAARDRTACGENSWRCQRLFISHSGPAEPPAAASHGDEGQRDRRKVTMFALVIQGPVASERRCLLDPCCDRCTWPRPPPPRASGSPSMSSARSTTARSPKSLVWAELSGCAASMSWPGSRPTASPTAEPRPSTSSSRRPDASPTASAPSIALPTPNPARRLRQPALSTRHDPRLSEEPPNDEDVEVAIWYRAPAIRLNESLGFERHPNLDVVDVWQWIDREGVEHGERVPCTPGLKSCRISPGLPRSCKDFRLESSGLLRLASLRGWRSFAVRQEGRRVGRPAAHGRRRGRW